MRPSIKRRAEERRDAEGRLVWGVNDFDEAFCLSYLNDLVRLITSAFVAMKESEISISRKGAVDAVIAGYELSLKCGGKPIVLAEEQSPLREMVRFRLRDPEKFWSRLEENPISTRISKSARRELERAMPKSTKSVRYRRRISGLGSLGRERFVAIADWNGARIAREVKRRVPSACVWAFDRAVSSSANCVERLVNDGRRCPDPFFEATSQWLVRRLSPDCSRIGLGALPKLRDEKHLLSAMGFEIGNVHLASGEPKRLLKDLASRPAKVLHKAAVKMFEATKEDWKEWKEHGGKI